MFNLILVLALLALIGLVVFGLTLLVVIALLVDEVEGGK